MWCRSNDTVNRSVSLISCLLMFFFLCPAWDMQGGSLLQKGSRSPYPCNSQLIWVAVFFFWSDCPCLSLLADTGYRILERSGKGAASKKHKKVSPSLTSSPSCFWLLSEHKLSFTLLHLPRLSIWLPIFTQHVSMYDSFILLVPILYEFFLTHSPVPFTNSCHICRVICTEVPFKHTFQECILIRDSLRGQPFAGLQLRNHLQG